MLSLHAFCQDAILLHVTTYPHMSSPSVVFLSGLCLLHPEVERFLNETEEYINKLTKKLVQYKAEEQAGEAVQEAIAEVS